MTCSLEDCVDQIARLLCVDLEEGKRGDVEHQPVHFVDQSGAAEESVQDRKCFLPSQSRCSRQALSGLTRCHKMCYDIAKRRRPAKQYGEYKELMTRSKTCSISTGSVMLLLMFDRLQKATLMGSFRKVCNADLQPHPPARLSEGSEI